LARWDGASTVKNGSAHGRGLHGNGTTTIMASHLSPKQVTTCFSVDRTASR
jgi:hypothetical protein